MPIVFTVLFSVNAKNKTQKCNQAIVLKNLFVNHPHGFDE